MSLACPASLQEACRWRLGSRVPRVFRSYYRSVLSGAEADAASLSLLVLPVRWAVQPLPAASRDGQRGGEAIVRAEQGGRLIVVPEHRMRALGSSPSAHSPLPPGRVPGRQSQDCDQSQTYCRRTVLHVTCGCTVYQVTLQAEAAEAAISLDTIPLIGIRASVHRCTVLLTVLIAPPKQRSTSTRCLPKGSHARRAPVVAAQSRKTL